MATDQQQPGDDSDYDYEVYENGKPPTQTVHELFGACREGATTEKERTSLQYTESTVLDTTDAAIDWFILARNARASSLGGLITMSDKGDCGRSTHINPSEGMKCGKIVNVIMRPDTPTDVLSELLQTAATVYDSVWAEADTGSYLAEEFAKNGFKGYDDGKGISVFVRADTPDSTGTNGAVAIAKAPRGGPSVEAV